MSNNTNNTGIQPTITNKILFIILGILCLFLCISNIKQCHTENQLKSNYVILADSIYEYKNKIGELYKEKQSYIVEAEELKRINNDLYNEVKNLKDNPIVVTKVETVTIIDSIFIENKGKIDSLSNIVNNYKYKDNYLAMDISHSLNSENLTGQLAINNINMNCNIFTNIVENKKDKTIHLLVKSDNPYLHINNINGGFVDLSKSKTLEKYYKRENRWGLTVTAGVAGIYDLTDKKVGFGPGVMLGISYNICTW